MNTTLACVKCKEKTELPFSVVHKSKCEAVPFECPKCHTRYLIRRGGAYRVAVVMPA